METPGRTRVRSRVQAAGARLTRDVDQLARLAELERRVRELEEEALEARRTGRRLAELMDVVEELLVPIAQRDDDRVQERLDRYLRAL